MTHQNSQEPETSDAPDLFEWLSKNPDAPLSEFKTKLKCQKCNGQLLVQNKRGSLWCNVCQKASNIFDF